MPATHVLPDSPVPRPAHALPLRLAAVGRRNGIRVEPNHVSVWLQLRGSARVCAKEGRFHLGAGEWIALDRGSSPVIEGDAGITIGLAVAPELMHELMDATDRGLITGRGRLDRSDCRTMLRLWRACEEVEGDSAAAPPALRALLRQWERAQEVFAPMVDRCPGRSFHRKTRIFSRIQKARLYLEAHPERMLRIDELMELTRFSSWWLSKTFHAVYQETLQKSSMRLRMERARTLLLENRLAIGELADACGFHDPCSFARQFKAWHGVTASAWRAAALRPGSDRGAIAAAH